MVGKHQLDRTGAFLAHPSLPKATTRRRSDSAKKLNNVFSLPGLRTIKFQSMVISTATARSARRFLDQVNHLESFEIRLGQEYYSMSQYPDNVHLVDILADGVQSESLQNLVLMRVCISVKTLMRLLGQGSIRALELRSCTLVLGSWRNIIDWIRKNMHSLRSLRLSDLSEAHRGMCPYDPQKKRYAAPNGVYRFRDTPVGLEQAVGYEEVQVVLDRLIRNWG